MQFEGALSSLYKQEEKIRNIRKMKLKINKT